MQFILIFDDISRVTAPLHRIFGLQTVDFDDADIIDGDVVLLPQGVLKRFHFLKSTSFFRVVHQNCQHGYGFDSIGVEHEHFLQSQIRVFSGPFVLGFDVDAGRYFDQ